MKAGESRFMVLDCSLDEIQIVVAPGQESDRLTREQQQDWEEMQAENDQLFNGPILSFDALDDDHRTIRCHRDWYARFAVQSRSYEHPLVSVCHFGVTGVIVCDQGQGPHVMLGKRGHQAWAYGGMWELGPAGGIDPPEEDPEAQWDGNLAWKHLLEEAREEAGITSGLTVQRVLGLCWDDRIHGCDLIIAAELDKRPTEANDNWEYDEIAWVKPEDIPRFSQEQRLIEPTRAILGTLGWLT